MKCHICGGIHTHGNKGKLWNGEEVDYCGTCNQTLQGGLKIYYDRLISNRSKVESI